MAAHILVVDDDKPLANALQLKLKHEGYEVTVAFDGEEALAKIAETDFDLVLLDLVMPKKDGFKVLEELRAQSKEVKVIVSSNLSQPEDKEKATALGALDYYIKSNTPLANIIEKVKKEVA